MTSPSEVAAAARPLLPASRPVRIALLTATGVLLVVAALEFTWLSGYIDSQHAVDADRVYYASVGQRWLDTGELYTARQLRRPVRRAGNVTTHPPTAIPFLWARSTRRRCYYLIRSARPALVARWRPAAWTWPILALLLARPRGISNIIYGNSDISSRPPSPVGCWSDGRRCSS
jgi:hypothetical protein